MTGEHHVKKNGRIYNHYRCLGPKNRDNPCTDAYAPVEKIHALLERHFIHIKFGPRFLNCLRAALMEVMHDQGKDIPSRIGSLEQRKIAVEKKMSRIEDEMIAGTIPKERIDQKYIPIRDELKSIEADLAKLRRPSANLDEQKIETIVSFLKDFPRLWKAFNPQEKKQFLKWFVQKVWIQKQRIVQIDYTDTFQACIDRDMVRITATWLRGMDSDHGSKIQSLTSYR